LEGTVAIARTLSAIVHAISWREKTTLITRITHDPIIHRATAADEIWPGDPY